MRKVLAACDPPGLRGAAVPAAGSPPRDAVVSGGPLGRLGREWRFGDGHPAGREVESQCSFNLHFSNDELY